MPGTISRASAAILIARGRDATDVAITTLFGPSTLVGFKVVTDEVPAEESASGRLRPSGPEPVARGEAISDRGGDRDLPGHEQ